MFFFMCDFLSKFSFTFIVFLLNCFFPHERKIKDLGKQISRRNNNVFTCSSELLSSFVLLKM